jgi:phage terminase large subunit GpA-like protein
VTIHLRNLERDAEEVCAEILEPPPPVDYLAWAERNIVFSKRESPFDGPYNRVLFPEFDEILTALSPEDPCRTVTVAKSAQLGGTVIANIFTLGSMDLAPGDFLVTHPTDDNARRWSKMKLSPMLKNTTALARLFPQKARDGSDSVLFKERVDGRGAIQISGANSPASLSQVSMPRQVQDDLAKWEMNAAGDPEGQADSRSRAFEFAKILKISTPLVNPGCRITRSYKKGSQERPWVPCPHCDEHQVLEWENLQASIEANPEDPHFICRACGCEIRQHDLPEMKRRLEWRAENPKAKGDHRSFWIWSAYSALQSWRRIAQEWLNSKGDPAQERVFFNDTLGLAYETKGEAPPWEELARRAGESEYERRHVPAGALLLTGGIDCQADRVEWQVVGWGREARSWTVEYGVIPGHISEPATQAHLDALLVQGFVNSVGRKLTLDLAAIDGNAWTEDVWAWARRHAKVIMVRGVGSDSAPLLAKVKKERSRTGKVLRYQSKFFNFGTSILKMALYRNLAKTDPLARGYVGLPRGLEDEFYRGLTAETRKETKDKKTGFPKYAWVKDPNQANEPLDTRLQAEAAAIKLGIRSFQDATWDKLEAERETPLQAAQGDLLELPLMAAQSSPSPAPPQAVHRKPGTPAGQDQAAKTPAPDTQAADRAAWLAKIAGRLPG